MSRTDAEILNDTAWTFGLTVDELTNHHNIGKSLNRTAIHARYALAHTLRKDGWPFEAIGCLLKRDHTTMIAACRRAEELLVSDPDFAARYAEVRG